MSYNRYRGADLVKDDHDWISPPTGLIDTTERYDDRFHTVRHGDRLDILAARYLGEGELWWVIAEFNTIFDFFAVKPGMVLRLPSYERLIMDILT